MPHCAPGALGGSHTGPASCARKRLFGLRSKAYHVAGACILATFLPSGAREHYVEIVAPLETIYDFLDSTLRPASAYYAAGSVPAASFGAVRFDSTRRSPLHEYYAFGPPGDDGDYLPSLVRRVRRALSRFGSHELLVPHFKAAAALYADTQTFKHLPPHERENACIAWYEREGRPFGDLSWWEFGAAAGSQFHVYGPLYAAFCSNFECIAPTYQAYFPAFSALHVLLDSFIDQEEDRAHGELNWIRCYANFEVFRARAAELARRARKGFSALPMPRAHTFALRIMSLFYLTHPKVYEQGLVHEATALLDALA